MGLDPHCTPPVPRIVLAWGVGGGVAGKASHLRTLEVKSFGSLVGWFPNLGALKKS